MTNFSITDAIEIAGAPHIAQVRRREEVLAAAHQSELDRNSGVSHSLYVEPRPAKSEAEIRAEGWAAYQRAQAFAESPRGRFLLAVRELEQLGWDAEAEKARAAFRRGFADPDKAVSPAEIGCALETLERVNHTRARIACLALADLLTVGRLHEVA